jgi:D-alanyl-D-alanine carboxypeptidase
MQTPSRAALVSAVALALTGALAAPLIAAPALAVPPAPALAVPPAPALAVPPASALAALPAAASAFAPSAASATALTALAADSPALDAAASAFAPSALGVSAAPDRKPRVVGALSGAGSLSAAGDAVLAAGGTGFAERTGDGRRVRTVTRGVADRETGRKLDAADEFQIGSNTKTFVATVMLQLVGEGRLRLDDPVARWFPAIPDADRITVRMLLQHTSGLFDYLGDDQVGAAVLAGSTHHWTPAELVAVGVSHPANFPPGAAWSYSNTNYVLAGMIMKRVTGADPAQLIARRIVGPLGLRHTYWAPDARFHGRHMHGYFRTEPGGTQYTDITDAPLYWADAAGAMVSTLDDLARFEQALQSGRLLHPAQLAQMRTTVEIEGPAGWKTGYGLGVSSLETPCGTFWGHTGGTLGYLTQAWSSADGRRSLIQVVPTGADTPTGPDAVIAEAAQSAALAGFC